MAKKAAKTTSSTPMESVSFAAAASASAPRVKKHVKAQAAGVVAAVEGFVNAIVHPEVAEAAPAPVAPAAKKPVTHDAVAKLAYEFYLERKAQGGSAADDWFRAERALLEA